MTSFLKIFLAFLLAGVASDVSLLAEQASRKEPVFGLYCTVKGSSNENLEFIQKCKAAGINVLYPSLSSEGGVIWRTTLENYSDELKAQMDKGFDSLSDFIKSAHEHKIKVIPSVAICPITLPASQHPKWETRDRLGRASSETTTRSIAFAYPEARANKVASLMDLVDHYDVDGILLDYCRYPENTVIPEAWYGFYGYDEPLLEACQKLYGFDPRNEPVNSPKWQLFNQLRMDSVTAFVVEFDDALRKSGKNITVGAFGDTDPELEAAMCGRDYAAWARAGLIDNFVVMNYNDSPATIGKTISRIRDAIGEKTQLYTALTPWEDRQSTEAQILDQARVQLEGDVDGLWIYRDDYFIKHDLWGAALKTKELIGAASLIGKSSNN